MTAKDLIELNSMITDLEITVRQGGNLLLDQLNIGPSEGVKPPYPTRVPKDARYAENLCRTDEKMFKDAAYIQKSINTWDDGKDYYGLKLNRIPENWLKLEVHSFEVWPASSIGTTSPRRRQTHFNGQLMKVVALPSGEKLEIKEPEKTEAEIPGQMNIMDFLEASE